MSYGDVLEMPTDMRLNYITYVSDQYEKRTKKTKKATESVEDMKKKAKKSNVNRNQTTMPFDNVKNN